MAEHAGGPRPITVTELSMVVTVDDAGLVLRIWRWQLCQAVARRELDSAQL
jgi:hypothetical protein